MLTKLLTAAIVATALAASPAFAAELAFSAALGGDRNPTMTGSPASGAARLRVNTDTQTIDMTMTVTGLSFDDLYDHVVHSAMGPVHLHLYRPDGSVALILPFPFGETYEETAGGFAINVSRYEYADGAAILGSDMTFDAFVASLQSDFVYLNVHTDAFTAGEISGRLSPARE